jgi:glycosyltransferase involved in cell wall biosynthesis
MNITLEKSLWRNGKKYSNQFWLMMSKFDLTYATVDSLAEGVGSSQIMPLMERLASHGLKINLITFEKQTVPTAVAERMNLAGVEWTHLPFGKNGPSGAILRTFQLARQLPDASITHARSDFPAVASRIAGQNRVLWDIRSLWADQRRYIEKSLVNRKLLSVYKPIENLACGASVAISTLTNSVVPILEERHTNLPTIRTVVPTAVDLERFQFSPLMPKSFKGLYSGTYNDYYDLELSSKFVQNLKRLIDCEIAWAKPKESIVDRLDAGENSTFTVSQPKMAELMSEYSFGISICKEDAGPSLKAAMPTKIAEFLAIGRPVVINAGLGDCDEIFAESRIGVVIRRNDDLAVKAKELIDLYNDKETSHRCRQAAEKYFDIEKGCNKYMNLYSLMNQT